MEDNFQDNGAKGNKMAMVCMFQKMGLKNKAFGKMEKELNGYMMIIYDFIFLFKFVCNLKLFY